MDVPAVSRRRMLNHALFSLSFRPREWRCGPWTSLEAIVLPKSLKGFSARPKNLIKPDKPHRRATTDRILFGAGYQYHTDEVGDEPVYSPPSLPSAYNTPA